jgi:hypothetical protein
MASAYPLNVAETLLLRAGFDWVSCLHAGPVARRNPYRCYVNRWRCDRNASSYCNNPPVTHTHPHSTLFNTNDYSNAYTDSHDHPHALADTYANGLTHSDSHFNPALVWLRAKRHVCRRVPYR